MSPQLSFTVPDGLSFEQAITLTQSLLAEPLDSEILAKAVAALVQTDNGARGFFVTFLAGESSWADHPPEAVIQGLQTDSATVADLLTKNLAMSTAMRLTHLRNEEPESAAGSERVQWRTANLIERLNLPTVRARLVLLQATLETGAGEYEAFLTRWGYDPEQRHAIGLAIVPLLG
jgi:hypothetical protein